MSTTTTTTTTTPILRPLLQNNLGNRYQKGKTSPDLNEADLNEARDDGVWDAVASGAPYANNLHLAPDR